MFVPMLLALAAPALATIYTTNPVASTKVAAGQVIDINWTDDGHAPDVMTIGVCSVDLCVGSTTKQTCIQNLAKSVDVSKATSVSATIDPSVGSDGDFYFIRYSALNYTDTANYDQAYQQFSSRFALTGMNGTFDADVMSQIAQGTGASGSTVGQTLSGAPTGSATAAPSGSAIANATQSAVSASKSAVSSVSASKSASGSVAAPAATTTTNGAAELVRPVAFALLAGLAGYIAI